MKFKPEDDAHDRQSAKRLQRQKANKKKILPQADTAHFTHKLSR